jgi:hypothetical protein
MIARTKGADITISIGMDIIGYGFKGYEKRTILSAVIDH